MSIHIRGLRSYMKLFRNLKPSYHKGQRGLTLMEALVAASIIAAIGMVFMNAIFVGHRGVGVLDEKIEAESFIRSQIEDVKNATFSDEGYYPVTVTTPSTYSLNISVGYPSCIGTADNCTVLMTDTLQEITVSCYHGSKHVLSIGCYKAKQ